MNYIYILLPVAVWIISQTIKFFVREEEKIVPVKLRSFVWIYIWAGGVPSTHTAILTSSLYLVWYNYGLSPIFTFCLAVTMLWLFDMTADHKRQEVMNTYFLKDGDLKKSVGDGFLIDLAGHTLQEVIWGAILGVVLGYITTFIIT